MFATVVSILYSYFYILKIILNFYLLKISSCSYVILLAAMCVFMCLVYMYLCIYVVYKWGCFWQRKLLFNQMNGLDGLHSQGISFRWLHAIDL